MTEGSCTITPSGAVVGRGPAFVKAVRAMHGDDIAREVMVARLPPDERWHVEQHRRRLDGRGED